jgi:hypothetical protein
VTFFGGGVGWFKVWVGAGQVRGWVGGKEADLASLFRPAVRWCFTPLFSGSSAIFLLLQRRSKRFLVLFFKK